MARLTLPVLAAAFSVLTCSPAFANYNDILSYMSYVSSSTIGTGPLGLVIVTQNGPDEVDIKVALDAHTKFVATGGPHNAFAFSLNLTTPYTETITTAGFAKETGSVTNTPYGSFTNGIYCDGCGSGGSNPQSGPLYFKITDSFGISLANFVVNSKGYMFSSDVMGPLGGTGNIASDARLFHAPLPATASIFLSALAGFGLFGLNRKRKLAAA